jgi:hypothetical protein
MPGFEQQDEECAMVNHTLSCINSVSKNLKQVHFALRFIRMMLEIGLKPVGNMEVVRGAPVTALE